jgi:hypothetical protein
MLSDQENLQVGSSLPADGVQPALRSPILSKPANLDKVRVVQSAAGRILTRRSGSTPWKNGLSTTLQRAAQLRELRGSHASSPFYFL